jgi:hypothetical protein
MTRFAFGTRDWTNGVSQGQQAAESAMANLLRQRQMGLAEDAALRDKWAFDQAKEQAGLVKDQREADTLIGVFAQNGQRPPDDLVVRASPTGQALARDSAGQLTKKTKSIERIEQYKAIGAKPTPAALAEFRASGAAYPVEWDTDKVFQNQQTLQSALPELKKRGDALGVDVTKLPAWIIANSEGNLDKLLDVDKELTAREQQTNFAAGLGVFQKTGDVSGLLAPGMMPQNAQFGIVQDQRAAATNLAKMRNDNQAFVDQLVARGVPREQAKQIASLPAGMRGELSAIDKTNADAAAKAGEAKFAGFKQTVADSIKSFDADVAEVEDRIKLLNNPTEGAGKEARAAYDENYASLLREREVRVRSQKFAKVAQRSLQQAAVSAPPKDPRQREQLMAQLRDDASMVMRREVSHSELIDMLELLEQQGNAVQSR